jgi:hypothetical protein
VPYAVHVDSRQVWAASTRRNRQANARDREFEGKSPEQVLTDVISAFSRNGDWCWVHAQLDGYPRNEAYVYRAPRTQALLIVGRDRLASALNGLVGDNEVAGWTLHPIAPTRTPLSELSELFTSVSGSIRYQNLLMRAGFVYAEEVASLPDDCLRDLPRGGTERLIASVHLLLAELGISHTCSVSSTAVAFGLSRKKPYLPERVLELERRILSLEELASRLRDELITLHRDA